MAIANYACLRCTIPVTDSRCPQHPDAGVTVFFETGTFATEPFPCGCGYARCCRWCNGTGTVRLPTPRELPAFTRTVYLAAADILRNHWHEVLTHHLMRLVGCDDRQLVGALARLANAGLVARPHQWESSSVVRVRGFHAAGDVVWPVFEKLVPRDKVLMFLVWWETCRQDPLDLETLRYEANMSYGDVSDARRDLQDDGLCTTRDTRLGDVTGMYVSLTEIGKVVAAELVARHSGRG